MEVLLEVLRSRAGHMVSDEDVCEMVQKVFDMRSYHSEKSRSNMMVRYTENVLVQMLIPVFSSLTSRATH